MHVTNAFRSCGNQTHSLTANVLNDVLRMVNIDPVKVDAWICAGFRVAIEDLRHAAAGPTPVRPEIDEGDAVSIDLYEETRYVSTLDLPADATSKKWYSRSN